MSSSKFTQTEKLLIYGLKQFHLTPEEAFWIFYMLKTEEQQKMMIRYLAGHLQATTTEIMKEWKRITGR